MKWFLNPPVVMKKFNILLKQSEIEQRFKKKYNEQDDKHVGYLLNGKEIH